MVNIAFFQKVLDDVESHFIFYAYAQICPNWYENYSTEAISEPLCEYIRNFRGPKAALHIACERQIVRILETHRLLFKLEESQSCQHMLAHMMLCVAARVAYLSRLPNSFLVVRLLSEIYRCDKSFKRLVMGGYHEPEDCNEAGQTESIFASLSEGLGAYRYFLYHANKERKLFFRKGIPTRMTNLSLEVDRHVHPATYAVAGCCPVTFKILAEHGSNLNDVSSLPTAYNVLETIRSCHPDNDTPEIRYCRAVYKAEHPEVLPMEEQTLLRLSRRAIRRHLNKSFMLPRGIDLLPIPRELKHYLNLEYD